MSKSKYSDELKAEVMAALLAGQSVTYVAESYDIPRGTVAGWSSKLNESGVPNVSNEKKIEIGDRLVESMHRMIDVQFTLLDKIANTDGNLPELATAYGILNDKLDRLMVRASNNVSGNNTPKG